MAIYSIIQELNIENGSNYKIKILQKHKDNELLKRVLRMTYDSVAYNYGVGKTTLAKLNYSNKFGEELSLEQTLDILENEFCSRDVTGNAAIERLEDVFSKLNDYTKEVVTKIIERDLKINIGKTQINKVFKDLITKPTYMRCDTYSVKTAKNISFPAVVQVKADGTYREFNVSNGIVTARSRSGEEYDYPVIFKQMEIFPNGIYTGELTVQGIHERSKGNGLINSDNPPHDDIVLELWDFISHAEYNKARLKDKKNPCTRTYQNRFEELVGIIEYNQTKNVKLIPYVQVASLKEALKQTSEWMNQGFEGAILKDWSGVFKDGTSKHQLKLKLEISVEMRCTGFQEGTRGTKREGKVGSIIFSNDEGTIQGRCSGFTDDELDYFTAHQSELIGKIMEVQFNDLTKAEGNDYYALSHPRFIEWRNDKNETDTLEKAFQLREMAMELSEN